MNELIAIFVNNIAPILIVAGAGYLAGKKLHVESASIGQLIFNVFSPALVFYSLYESRIGGAELSALAVGTLAFQVVMAILSYGVMRLRPIGKIERVSVILSAVSLNTGNFGLSVATFAFGEAVLARAVVVYIANTILNYTLGVFVASSGRETVRGALLNIMRVPAVYATIAALIFKAFELEVPLVVYRSISVLKDAAIPAMLVLLGIQISQSVTIRRWKLVGAGVFLKLLIAPLVGVVLAFLLQLNGAAAAAFILQISMPTAVITLIMAKEYGLDETLVLNLIIASTLLSPFTVSVIILFLQQIVI